MPELDYSETLDNYEDRQAEDFKPVPYDQLSLINDATDIDDENVKDMNDDERDSVEYLGEKRLWFKRDKQVFLFHLLIWLALTTYFITAMIISPNNSKISLLIFLYTFLSLKLVFKHFSTRLISEPVSRAWTSLILNPLNKIPRKSRRIGLYGFPVVLIVALIMISPDTDKGTRIQRVISLVGLSLQLLLMWSTSTNRKAINWHTVYMGLLLQFLLGIFTLRTELGNSIFAGLAELVAGFLDYSKAGARLILGDIIDSYNCFALIVLPGVIFFAAAVQVVYYLGWMQWVIKRFAYVMVRIMDTSGSESVVAAASPFIGQGESALLVKPFLEYMTTSELHSVMVSGFATIAGMSLSLRI